MVHGIVVSAICPGFVSTNITKGLRVSSGTEKSSALKMATKADKFFMRFGYSPEKVARSVLRAVEKNKSVVIVDNGMRMVDLAHRLNRGLVGSQVKHLVRMMDRWL